MATVGLGAFVTLSGHGADPAVMQGWPAQLGLTLALFGTLAGVTLAWIRRWERRPLASAGFVAMRTSDLGLWVIGAVWSATMALLLLNGSTTPAGPSVAAPGVGTVVLMLMATAIVVALLATAEEVVFRGWALSALGFRVGPGVALAITSLLFGAAHVFPWEWGEPARLLSFAGFSAMGAAFGATALARRSLWSAAALHAGYNFALAALGAAASGFDPAVMWSGASGSGSGFDDLRSAAALAFAQGVMAAAAIAWWRWSVTRRRAPSPAASPAA